MVNLCNTKGLICVGAQNAQIGIQKWCPYRYWHFGTLVQYPYRHSPLPVLAFQKGARTGIGNFVLWFSTGMGTFHYQYWHSVVLLLVLAIMYLSSVPVWAHSITGTGIQLCLYQYWRFCTLVQYQYGRVPLLVLSDEK